MSKKIKAPDYFLDNKKDLNSIGEEIGKIIGVGEVWLQAREGANLPIEMVNKLSRGDWFKLQILMSIRSSYIQYGWAKFKLNNLDNEFGKAESLIYDQAKHNIVIRKSVQQHIKEFAGKLKGKFPELTRERL